MKTRIRHFSFIEVIIVVVILVIVMSLAVISVDTSPGETRIKVEDQLKTVFGNAAIRAQAFNNEVMLSFKPDEEGFFSCSLKSKKAKSVLSAIPEDETEDEALEREDREATVRIWSGEDEYDEFGEDVQLAEYYELLNEEEEILFFFYPDGEATGPNLKLKILEEEYNLTVGRLNGQLQMTKVEY